MQQPTKWLIGIPILAGIIYFANDSLTRRIETDLAARAEQRLASSKGAIDRAKVVVKGRDIVVSGVVLSEAGRNEALAQMRMIEGARAVLDETKQPATVQPFVLLLERKGRRVSLLGSLPPGGAREQLQGELKRLGFEVADGAVYANGAPPKFTELARFAAERLAELAEGRATLKGDTLSIKGAAQSSEALEKLVAAVKSPPAGGRVAEIDVTPPQISPYAFSATFKEGLLTLGGYAPSAAAREEIFARAATAILERAPQRSALAVDEKALAIGGGAPSDFIEAAKAGLAALAQLLDGGLTLQDHALTLSGEAPKGAAAGIAERLTAALPTGFNATPQLDERAPAQASAEARVPAAVSAQLSEGVIKITGAAPPAQTGAAEASAAAFAALARLSSGSVTLDGRIVTLTGEAPKSVADVGPRLARALPQGFGLILNLSPDAAK